MKKLLLLLFLIPNLVMGEEKINVSLVCEGIFDTYMDGSRISHEEGFTQYIKIENNILISNVLGIKPIGGAKYKLTISPNKISTLKQGAEEHWFAFDLDRHSGKLSWMNRNNNIRLDYKAICKKFDKAKKKF